MSSGCCYSVLLVSAFYVFVAKVPPTRPRKGARHQNIGVDARGGCKPSVSLTFCTLTFQESFASVLWLSGLQSLPSSHKRVSGLCLATISSAIVSFRQSFDIDIELFRLNSANS